jgi:hypothetical protein
MFRPCPNRKAFSLEGSFVMKETHTCESLARELIFRVS